MVFRESKRGIVTSILGKNSTEVWKKLSSCQKVKCVKNHFRLQITGITLFKDFLGTSELLYLSGMWPPSMAINWRLCVPIATPSLPARLAPWKATLVLGYCGSHSPALLC